MSVLCPLVWVLLVPRRAKKPAKKASKKAAKRRRPNVRRLTIDIEERDSHDGSSIGIYVDGMWIDEVFSEGDMPWNNIKGAVMALLEEIGLTKNGRRVSIHSEP